MKKQVTSLKLLQKSKCLQIQFASGEFYELPCLYLRLYSPAAEDKISEDKVAELIDKDINITQIDPVGNYAVKFYFTDGHQSSIYSWDYLQQLGERYHAVTT